MSPSISDRDSSSTSLAFSPLLTLPLLPNSTPNSTSRINPFDLPSSHPNSSHASVYQLPALSPPSSVLIVGSGVFGLSTALALTRRPDFANTSITVVDRSAVKDEFPARDASSIDSSRIIRADYADPAYAALAAQAQQEWRKTGDHELGGQGRYHETGLMLVGDGTPSINTTNSTSTKKTGMDYVRASWENVKSIAAASQDVSLTENIRELPNQDAIRSAYGTGGSTGHWGYLNGLSGWADAEASMAWLYRRVQATGRVKFRNGTVSSLTRDGMTVTGATLSSGETLAAELVILAAGAWTPSLVDLSGQAVATAQVLAYMDITDEEQAKLANIPTLLNLSTGYFIITPSKNVLKIARHAYGYVNPTQLATPVLRRDDDDDESPHVPTTISHPVTHLTSPDLSIPAADRAALRAALREMVPLPSLADRPFTRTRLCWYTDTPDGDFVIDYHPYWTGLFVATGGSGHGFKFLPVIGDKIVDCVMGQCPEEFKHKWAWKTGGSASGGTVVTEDGSRGGRPGLILQEEMGKATTN